MPPIGVDASHLASPLVTGAAKLWVLLIGVNQYIDSALPSLRYAAIDCQGVGTALASAAQSFPHQEFLIYNDLQLEKPTLANVESSLRRIASQAKVQDTVVIYFSGHGVVDPVTQQTVLCVRDTDRDKLLSTGLQIGLVLEMLGNCAAHSQLLWLDACHSGNINFNSSNHSRSEANSAHPTTQLLASLRQRSVQNRGFYALLSCDEEQQSWEFPDLGHGVFSYFLMRALYGEAADDRGMIDADNLYRYVYRQTVQYIDRLNEQLRLVDREKRDRGEISWSPEYSAQTPKRIVSGVGEIIIGVKSRQNSVWHNRAALTIDLDPTVADAFSQILRQDGKFNIDDHLNLTATKTVNEQIHSLLAGNENRQLEAVSTRLLYLRGELTDIVNGDAWCLMADGSKLSRAWLRQELHRAKNMQQIIILDCPAAPLTEDSAARIAADWVEYLKITQDDFTQQFDRSEQCIIACAAPAEDAELFPQVLLEALIAAAAETGLAVAGLCTRLATNLAAFGIPCHYWISATQGLIEILPATVAPESADVVTAKLPPEPQLPISAVIEPPVETPDITFAQHYTYLQPVWGGKTDSNSIEPIITSPCEDRASAQPPLAANHSTISAPPTELIQSLESILRQLIGPVAPALIANVNQQAQATNPATLIARLLPLLPPNVRADFERQTEKLLARQSERVETPPTTPPQWGENRSIEDLTPSPKTARLEKITTPQSCFSPSTRSAIEQTLKEEIGPVATVLLREIAPTAWTNDRALIDAIRPHLKAERIAEFIQRIQPILASATMVTVEKPSSSPQSGSGRGIEAASAPVINPEFTKKCERELTLAIGPVAKYIIAEYHQANSHLSPTDFVTGLSRNIPNPQQAEAFCLAILPPPR